MKLSNTIARTQLQHDLQARSLFLEKKSLFFLVYFLKGARGLERPSIKVVY